MARLATNYIQFIKLNKIGIAARNYVFAILILVTATYSCSPKPQVADTVNKKNVVKKAASTNDDILKIAAASKDSYLDAHTYNACKLYAAADTNTEVIAELPAMIPLNIIDKVEITGTDTVFIATQKSPVENYWSITFLKVKAGTHEGYVKVTDVAIYVIKDQIAQTQYYIGYYFDSESKDYKFRMSKFNLIGNKLISRLIFDGFYNYELYVSFIKNNSLKDVTRMIKIMANGEYCGGGQNEVLVADANNTLVLLPQSFISYDDGGGIFSQMAYLPKKDSNGVITLQSDTIDSKATMLPGILNIPTNELIAQITDEGAYAIDDDNEYIKLKNGKYKMERPLTRTTQYYHWNGSTIKKLPGKTVVKLPEKAL